MSVNVEDGSKIEVQLDIGHCCFLAPKGNEYYYSMFFCEFLRCRSLQSENQ